jgi:hypothetical protein
MRLTDRLLCARTHPGRSDLGDVRHRAALAQEQSRRSECDCEDGQHRDRTPTFFAIASGGPAQHAALIAPNDKTMEFASNLARLNGRAAREHRKDSAGCSRVTQGVAALRASQVNNLSEWPRGQRLQHPIKRSGLAAIRATNAIASDSGIGQCARVFAARKRSGPGVRRVECRRLQ